MNKLIDLIATLLAANVKTPRGIKTIYKGEIFTIPDNNLPCIIINPVKTSISTLTNAEDKNEYSVSVALVTSAMRYLNNSATEEAGFYDIAKTIEEQNSDGTLKNDTIAYCIRHSLFANGNLRIKNDTIDYGFSKRQALINGSMDFYPTLEVHYTFTVEGLKYLR